MPYKCFNVRQLPRILKRNFRLWFVAWMPEHIFWNRNRVLDQGHFCFILRTEPGSEPLRRLVNGVLCERKGDLPAFYVYAPGTRLHTLNTRHQDELMFTVPPECFDELMEALRPLNGSFRMNVHIERCIREILECMENIYVPGQVDRMEGIFLRLLEETSLAVFSLKNDTAGDALIYEVISFINAHFMEGITLDDVCVKYSITRITLYRRWRETFDHTPAEFLLKKRLEYAEQLLLAGDLSIKLIAARCGFENPVSFAHSFQREYGMSPSKWRQERLR